MLLDSCGCVERSVDRPRESHRHSREEVRATANMVVNEALVHLLLAEVLHRIRPENVAHQALRGRLPESIDLHARQ